MTTTPNNEISQRSRSRGNNTVAVTQADILQLLADVELELKHSRVFVTTRERMHPTGVELYDQNLSNLEVMIENLSTAQQTKSGAVSELLEITREDDDAALAYYNEPVHDNCQLAYAMARHRIASINRLYTHPATSEQPATDERARITTETLTRDDIHKIVANTLRAQDYWKFDIQLGDDGGFEANWLTREGSVLSTASEPLAADTIIDLAMRLAESDCIYGDEDGPDHCGECHGCLAQKASTVIAQLHSALRGDHLTQDMQIATEEKHSV